MMTEKTTSANGMKELHDTLRAEMATAQLGHQENYNSHRKPDPNLKLGDMVWFLPRNVHTTRPSKKLDYKKIGQLKILARIGTSAYKLAFPPWMRIHNTIHISLLEPYQDNRFPSQIQEPPPPIQIEGEDEHELNEIIDSRLHYNKLQSRAKWKGYGPEEDKVWYPAENFNNAADAGRKFHERYPEKPQLGEGRETSSRPSRTSRRVGRFVGHLRPISPSSPGYSGASEKEVEHASMSWTACYDYRCFVHLSEKQGRWFPKGPKKHTVKKSLPYATQPSPPPPPPPQQPPKPKHGNTREMHVKRVSWNKCNRKGCKTHKEEKRMNKTMRTRLEGEGDKKPQEKE